MCFDDYFPEKKLNETKTFLRNVWAGKEKTVFSAYPSEPVYRQLEDDVEAAKLAVLNITASESFPGYNIPRLIADFGKVSTAGIGRNTGAQRKGKSIHKREPAQPLETC